jgi:hypothetical protein
MNSIKRFAGIVWILLGPAAIYYLVKTASEEIAKKPVIDTKIQWIVFVVIFHPGCNRSYDLRLVCIER